MKNLLALKTKALKHKKQLMLAGGLAVASVGSAHADIASEISGAISSATTNVTSASVGYIAIAAILMGVGLVVGVIRK
jgi:hypothetical protein